MNKLAFFFLLNSTIAFNLFSAEEEAHIFINNETEQEFVVFHVPEGHEIPTEANKEVIPPGKTVSLSLPAKDSHIEFFCEQTGEYEDVPSNFKSGTVYTIKKIDVGLSN